MRIITRPNNNIMRTTNIRFLYDLKKKGEEVVFKECPICNCVYGTTEKITITCSYNCDIEFKVRIKKSNLALKKIVKKNLATEGEIILGNEIASIIATDFNARSYSEGKTEFNYVLKTSNVYITLKKVKPLKRSYETNWVLEEAE
jgi:hypothetical protein